MDSSNLASFNHRTECLATGRTYEFVDQVPLGYKPSATPTLLCVHGFPDLWYGWRYVIRPWVQECGWRVVVPNMLGYGGTDKPINAENYSFKSLCADLAALLDIIGVQKAVLIGHDWGSVTVWRFALWYPDRIKALVPISTPFTPRRPDYLTLEQVVERLPMYSYQLYFNDPSSTKELEDHLPYVISRLYAVPKISSGSSTDFSVTGSLRSFIVNETPLDGLIPLLKPKEYQYYLDTFRAGGMNGPLNYYRTSKHNFDEESVGELPTSFPPSLPVLFFWGEIDRTCPPHQVERMSQYVPSLRVVKIPGKSHWLLLESPDMIADNVSKFVRAVYGKPDGAKL